MTSKMTPKKAKFVFITVLAFVLAMVAAIQLRSGLDASAQVQVLGWGFVMIFSCIFFVRGIYAINRTK